MKLFFIKSAINAKTFNALVLPDAFAPSNPRINE